MSSLQPDLDAALFPKFTPEQIAALDGFGTVVDLAPDEQLFAEGQDEHDFYVVLAGRLKVTRGIGGDEVILALHDPGEFTGALSLLSGEKSIANAYAVGPARVQRICVNDFRRMIVEQPQIAGAVLAAMARRRPAADTLIIEREKLAALGKMAAGLAHELNNPASAASRAAGDLRQTLANLQAATAALVCLLPPDAWKRLTQTLADTAAARRALPPLSPLERSDREETLGAWLEERGIADAWKLAPPLADAGLDTARLAEIEARATPDALPDALAWAAARLEADELLHGIEQSASRIADLVSAIKSYSYMDQAPRQEVNIAEGLENTLTILAHKWRKRGIAIERHYSLDLPPVEAYGSELNQVWTNLLDNAIDAVPPTGGRITIDAAPEDGSALLVAITDNGSGIAPEIQNRIFEPFFTTKAPGKGAGLGLDTTYRIVTQRHGGDIRFTSSPSGTRFEVRLPLQR